MSALGLGSYASDASSEDEGDAEPPYPLTQPVSQGIADDESDEEEEEEEAAEDAAEAEAAGPVVPLALSSAADDEDEDYEDDAHAQEEEEEDASSGLPAPDFSDWPYDPEYSGPAQPTGPQVTVLGKRERPKGGAAQISRGFSAAVTRRDQLKAKAESDLSEAAEVRGRNNGLSSAYDSVFHVPESSMTEEELDRQSRMRTTKKGGVRMISKKELAKEKALEASLM